MKSFVKIGVVLGVSVLAASCFNKSKPNYQYFPNMYEAVGYEAYDQSDAFPGGMEAMYPVEGTIARGQSLYEYTNTNEGYEAAKANLVSTLDSVMIEDNMAKGKELYDIYCAVCHGTKGDGQGILVKREKFLGIPNYADREITEGSIYHVIYWGRNSMGSYAAQLNEKERWQVTEYVMKLRENLVK
ncbi:c-type cytochrome [Abyssalbus ytuae]|uniref:Cytochrome c n=1 Tax=Abyssalbus ytuae TaxID=2926907 RepID=A0A9E6ZY01_9FLAO|nr:cytochrome c [Abyssalbus ytuae]UOB19006.1 cytochrome c [Abyssalbus ytuae]